MGLKRHYCDKVAVVTGAGSGIGAALTRALAGLGATVYATDRELTGVEALAAGLEGVIAAPLDVTDVDAFDALIQRVVSEHGHIDLLFNNAGLGMAGEVRDTSLDDWRRVMEVNIFGVIHGVSAAYPVMVRQGSGHIVNTASGAGVCPRPGMVPYAASKYAVVGLSESLRYEAAALGVRVSAICPGFIATNILSATEYKNINDATLRAAIPVKAMSADKCARIALREVARNRGIILITKALHFEHWLQRWAPWLARLISRYRAKKFRQHRVDG